jgi:N-acetylmuramoyl-L-alanine amidase
MTAEKVWLDGANADLRSKRKSGDVLLPGDIIFVPEVEEEPVDAATEQRHRFRRLGKAYLHIVVRVDGESLGGEEYEISVNGITHTGTVADDGQIDLQIAPDATEGWLEILGRRFELSLGQLDPADSVSGAQARLGQLGYPVGPVDDIAGSKTEAALKAFQKDQNLDISGRLDDATASKLQEIYGA